jgi:type IV pilus assembly protein PilM
LFLSRKFCPWPPLLAGIDMNAEEIRLLVLSRTRKSYRVEKFAVASLPAGIFHEGKIKHPESLQAALKQLVVQTRTQALPAAMALPATAVIFKRITLPQGIAKKNIHAHIASYCSEYFPGLQDALCFDFMTLPAAENSSPQVLLVASRMELLNSYLALGENAGLKVKIIDVDIYALARAAHSQSAKNNATAALLDITLDMTQLLLCQEGEIIFRHHWQTVEGELLRQELQLAIQMCSPKLTVLDSFIVSGKTLAPDFLENFQFIPANPCADFSVAADVDSILLQHYASRLSLCAGLALRDIPTW